MQHIYNFSTSKKELDLLNCSLRDVFAYLTEENIDIHSFTQVIGFMEAIMCEYGVPLACVDVVAERGIEAAEAVRSKSESATVVIIADLSMSPQLYLKPSIMASSLLLRPLDIQKVKKCIEEVVRNITASSHKRKNESFLVRTQGNIDYLDFNDIYYFEARGKRIYVNTKRREIGFYSTLEELDNKLPSSFKRCHRSFIVNMDKVEKIEVPKSLIYLKDNILLPLSRGYKEAFK